MPKWICPNCSASHNVTLQHAGKTARCQKCGQPSVVVVSEDEDSIGPDTDTNTEFQGTLQRLRSPQQVQDRYEQPVANQPESTSSVAKGLLGVILSLWILITLVTFAVDDLAPSRSLAVVTVSVLVAQMILVWPFYTACDDLRALRRMMENGNPGKPE